MAEPKKEGRVVKALRDWAASMRPTNYNMLVFRTTNRDLGRPNCNSDHIAPLFRDKLMPVRGWVNSTFPSMHRVFKNNVENPRYGVPGVCNFVDARTKFIDGALKAALADGFEQVVCIAAGFDTRAYRFFSQGVTFYEIDLPKASKKKQELVKATLPPPEELPRPVYVGADLSKVTLAEALAPTSFNPSKKTFFTCEGLIYYLPTEAVSNLFASVASISAPGSRLVFDFLREDALDGSREFVGYRACSHTCALKGEPFISGLPSEGHSLETYLASVGLALDRVWSAKEMVEKQLPHEIWDEQNPPILSFYGYAECHTKEATEPLVSATSPTQSASAAAEVISLDNLAADANPLPQRSSAAAEAISLDNSAADASP